MKRNHGRKEARRSSNKEISALIQKARQQGWSVMFAGSGHVIFRSPDKSVPQIVVPSTPGGGNRSVENNIAKLKRSGLVMNRRRRVRRNGLSRANVMIMAGVGVALAAAFVLRSSARTSMAMASGSAGPGGSVSPAASAGLQAAREHSIARLMALTPGLSRADAAVRYDRMMSAVISSATSASGIGSYYRA